MFYLYLFITFLFLFFLIKYLNGYHMLSIMNTVWKANTNLFYDTTYDWCKELRDSHKEIRDEFLEYQRSNHIPTFGQISKEQQFLADYQEKKWRVAVLYLYGKDTKLCEQFPITYSIVKKIPNCRLCMFSILEPHKSIPPHKGPNNCILRYHLGIITPQKKEECYMTIDNNKVNWEEGKDMLFDDTYEHYVENNTDEQRVVLFLDIQKKYENPFLNVFNDILFYLSSFNSTVVEIYNNVQSF